MIEPNPTPCDVPTVGPPLHTRNGHGDVLAIGFATVVAMWAVGYIARMPGIMWPSWAIGIAMFALVAAGGWAAGRLTRRGWRGGVVVGFLIATLNLLVLGAMLRSDGEAPAPNAALWVPGTFAGSMILAGGAGWVGSVAVGARRGLLDWTFVFAVVAVVATGLLVMAGGVVTGREAGLAVPDWPSSYGYNMFFYPLVRMTGNIYYEHAHRLVGSLVGLTTIALAVHIWIAERRRWVRTFAIVAALFVIVQGVMGGLRVELARGEAAEAVVHSTEIVGPGVEVARREHETTSSRVLRVVHGISGQLFLAVLAGLATVLAPAWKRAAELPDDSHPATRRFALALIVSLLIQLLLGALLRHLNAAMMLHIFMAGIVFFLAIGAGMSAMTVRRLNTLGLTLLIVVLLQIVLGVIAFILRDPAAADHAPSAGDVIATTAHQLNGGLLLALATSITLLAFRRAHVAT